MTDRTHTSTRRRQPLARLVTAAVVALLLAAQAWPVAVQAQPVASPDQSDDPAVAFYVADYGVSKGEALARLARIDPLQDLMESIREIEAERLAGWGIDHQGRFTAWVLLVGTEPAFPDANNIAASQVDLEIRTGAAHTYTELLSGQRQLMSLGATDRTDESVSGTRPLEVLADMIAVRRVAYCAQRKDEWCPRLPLW